MGEADSSYTVIGMTCGHCVSSVTRTVDAIEGITHSLCSLEFKDNNDIYRWLVREAGFDPPPEQTEFSRLELEYTVMSKRKLLKLVNEGLVSGWDDPRMPTISGYRRKGYTPESIRAFCKHIGVNKFNSVVEIHVLENFLREDLNKRALRKLAVLRPVKASRPASGLGLRSS